VNRIEREGTYHFLLPSKDREDRSAYATLSITINEEKTSFEMVADPGFDAARAVAGDGGRLKIVVILPMAERRCQRQIRGTCTGAVLIWINGLGWRSCSL